jgi:hypothetical protein
MHVQNRHGPGQRLQQAFDLDELLGRQAQQLVDEL